MSESKEAGEKSKQEDGGASDAKGGTAEWYQALRENLQQATEAKEGAIFDSAKYEKYTTMLRHGLPEAAVRQKMAIDKFGQDEISLFLSEACGNA
jgi:hypothetical protein